MSNASSPAVPQRQPAYPIDPDIVHRWSPRSFLEKEVPDNVLMSVLEAARWAPSAFNVQPWRFIVARTREERETFLPFISEFNRIWCEKAPVLILVLSKTVWERGEVASHAFDTGSAWGYLALEATKLGLVTHPMAGFDHAQARETLGVPEEYAIQALVALGYQGPKEALPEQLQAREVPSPRVPVGEIAFRGKFGHSL
ncbi:nitroreductase family protein [Cohnella zeiphila]|uniref:Nitroreductase family protein n=1 Tax=Cohnella zeiphila TaxID=2761120 RepID=A0A7X0SQN2_9BACL|nr:nitroreductase family protein [Cohnella zeiphila]MBB6733155.1 nitroreductase family protein [Cohnella zeiphila]